MRRFMLSRLPRPACILALSIVGLAGAASGQILSDGDLDALTPGTAPDCGTPNGAWLFPQNYIDAVPTACEATPEDFTVVTTDSFDPGAKGNSLQLDISNPDPNINAHLTNLFNQVIKESDGVIVTVTFDIFVAEEGRGGGSIYIGGDHGGGGYSNATDRGPQFAFFPDGTIMTNQQGAQVKVVDAYPFGKWQSLRVEIDLASDTYDLYWGLRGEDLAQVGDNLLFRVVALDHLDRFSMAHFGATVPSDHAYVDNVVVSVPAQCYPDCNGDGGLDLFDFLCFTNDFNTGGAYSDCVNDGAHDLFDFLCFLNAFNAGC